MAALILLGGSILGVASPADALPPYPAGARADFLTGGNAMSAVNCPPDAISPINADTNGSVSVSSASASCNSTGAQASGFYSLPGTTSEGFTSSCVNGTGGTSGGVTVPAGTSINGGTPVGAPTPVAGSATAVFPGGFTANLNVVIVQPPPPADVSVTRIAIQFTNPAGVNVGRVQCGVNYPLAVTVVSPGDAVSDLSGQLASGKGTSIGPILAGGVAVLIAAQVLAVFLLLRRRATSP